VSSSGGPALVASRYNTLTPSALPDAFLAFNVFTGALLELDARDYAMVAPLAGRPGAPAPEGLPPALRDRLVAAGVLVPAGFDERDALFALRRRALDAPDTLLLTIAPTIQCNFRCTYCFEAHRQEVMTPEVEADLLRFVARQAEGVRVINTAWFGGEPLLHPDLIERVQRRINELGAARGARVSRAIVTNGYFLTADVIRRLQALGDWKTVQITIDGLPAVHDSRRVLAGGRGTWDRIVRNCRTAIELGFDIDVRVNVDRRNAATLGDVIDRLVLEGILPHAHISLGFVVDATVTCAGVKPEVLPDEERARISIWFDAEMLRRNLLPPTALPSPLCGPMCSVESKLGYVIAPSGLIFKCWNQVDAGEDQAIGHVSGRPVPNADAELARWARYDPATRKGCSNCRALPTCMGGCPWEYERLARVHHGECDSFRFFPEEIVRLGHLRARVRREERSEVAAPALR
jgi:uncharacterized protein